MATTDRAPHSLQARRGADGLCHRLLCCLVMSGAWGGYVVVAAEPLATSGQVLSVSMLDHLPPAAEPLRLEVGDLQIPSGGHLQGIQELFDASQLDRRLLVLSHDSLSEAYLVVAEVFLDANRSGRVIHVQRLPSDGQSPPLRHAGGMQLAGQVLAVGVEDNQRKLRSEIQFWDFSKPQQPAQLNHLTIQRRGSAPKDMTAGAVGLVRRQQDFLLAVANWDSRAVDFYVSNDQPLANEKCRFAFHSRWEDARADKDGWIGGTRFGTYQAVNLVVDAAGHAALVGFDTTATGDDLVDLFALDMRQVTGRRLRKLAGKTVRLVAENHFRYAAGIAIDGGNVSLLASPRTLERNATLSIVRLGTNAKPVRAAGQPK